MWRAERWWESGRRVGSEKADGPLWSLYISTGSLAHVCMYVYKYMHAHGFSPGWGSITYPRLCFGLKSKKNVEIAADPEHKDNLVDGWDPLQGAQDRVPWGKWSGTTASYSVWFTPGQQNTSLGLDTPRFESQYSLKDVICFHPSLNFLSFKIGVIFPTSWWYYETWKRNRAKCLAGSPH